VPKTVETDNRSCRLSDREFQKDGKLNTSKCLVLQTYWLNQSNNSQADDDRLPRRGRAAAAIILGTLPPQNHSCRHAAAATDNNVA